MSARRDGSKLRSVDRQLERLREQISPIWEGVINERISLTRVAEWLADEVKVWRERRYSPLTTLMMFIGQVVSADASCKDAVARETARGKMDRSQSTGPYCKARQRLSLKLIERFAREMGEQLRVGQSRSWCWRGREVKLVDGTTVSMPDTPENQKRFPQSRTQKVGLGFPVARLLAIVSLSCGACLEWAVGPCAGKSSGETSMLWSLAGCLKRGDVVLADRYYAGYFMIAMLMQRGADVVIRQHQLRHTDFRRGKRLGKCDHVVEWAKPPRPAWMDADTYAAMPEQLTLREVRVGNWIIVASLLDPKAVPKRELSDLYRQRWQVELDLRSIKSVMQMDIVRCLSPDMVEKEIAVHLLAYNLVRTVMAEVACLSLIHPRQLSFKAAMQLLRAFAEDLCRCPRSHIESRYDDMLRSMARHRPLYRPGRVEPRVKKRRSKNYPLMTKPRNALKKPLIKQKHRIESLLR